MTCKIETIFLIFNKGLPIIMTVKENFIHYFSPKHDYISLPPYFQ